MPIFRHNGEMHFFAHVPKCGGQSVEAYLQARFGPLAFLNNDYLGIEPDRRWTRSSPQHVDRVALNALIPADWFASSFAVVRHPLNRLISVYNYLSIHHKTIPADLTIEEWLTQNISKHPTAPFAFDNHFALQSELVPESATVFKLEDGLDAIVAHLDTLTGDQTSPRAIEHLNKRLQAPDAEFRALPVSPEFCDRIGEHYSADFDRFGYSAHPASLPRVFVPRRGPGTQSAPPTSGLLPGFLRRKTIRSISGDR